MIRMRYSFYIFLSILLVTASAQALQAAGSIENRKNYEAELQELFPELIREIYGGVSDIQTAKDEMSDLRHKYDISYTDETGVLEAIIDRSAERQFSKDEAVYYFDLLNNGKLMNYRQETYRQQTEQHKRELLSLLKQNSRQIENPESGSASLTAVLNNYYDFVGMKYDDDYFELKKIIGLLRAGDISAGQLETSIELMDRELVEARNRRIAEENLKNRSLNATARITDDSGSGSRNTVGREPGTSSSPPDTSQVGPGGQKKNLSPTVRQ